MMVIYTFAARVIRCKIMKQFLTNKKASIGLGLVLVFGYAVAFLMMSNLIYLVIMGKF